MYPSGQDDPSASYPERVPSINSSFEEEEEDSDVDVDLDGSKSSTNEDSENKENVKSPIRSFVGLDSLRIFPLCGWSTTLTQPLKENILSPYRKDTRSPTTSPSVYPISLKKAITMVLMTSGCISKCSRWDLDCLWVLSTIAYSNT